MKGNFPVNILSVFVQLADFIVKACISYLQTEDGKKELADIEKALGVES